MQTPIVGATVTFITETMKTAMSDGFAGIATDVTSMVATALPYAIGIAGISIAVRLSWKFFKGVAN